MPARTRSATLRSARPVRYDWAAMPSTRLHEPPAREASGDLLGRLIKSPGRVALVLALSALVIGGGIFSFVEDDASLVDGWWWAFVSMTTVGYGDIAPKTSEIRVLAGAMIACGIAATAIATAAVAGRVAEWRLVQQGVSFELDDDFDEVLERVRALKVRYCHDEQLDDGVARHAVATVAAWKGGDQAELERSLAALSDELSRHPELRGAAT